MRELLVLGGVAVALYALGQWWSRAGPAGTARLLRWVAVILAAAALLWLTARGGGALALLLASLALPLLRRWKPLGGVPSGGAGTRGSSQVQTRFLDMELDHASGRLSGTVREGPSRGRALDELDQAELRALWRLCQGDPQSSAVLESYLERQGDPHWRDWARDDGTGGHRGAEDGTMSREEAYAVLGLAPGAGDEAVRAAHRRLMQRVHPDQGGSDYLAARINEAKHVLLGS